MPWITQIQVSKKKRKKNLIWCMYVVYIDYWVSRAWNRWRQNPIITVFHPILTDAPEGPKYFIQVKHALKILTLQKKFPSVIIGFFFISCEFIIWCRQHQSPKSFRLWAWPGQIKNRKINYGPCSIFQTWTLITPNLKKNILGSYIHQFFYWFIKVYVQIHFSHMFRTLDTAMIMKLYIKCYLT